jgi:3-phosphoglycerate kinase
VVSDDTRIRRVMPGVQSLLERGAKVVVLTHFGRPKGTFVPALTCAPLWHNQWLEFWASRCRWKVTLLALVAKRP